MDNYDQVKDGACYMCDLYCPTKIFLKNGTAVKMEMIDETVKDLCPRWKAQLDFVYHPERLQYPVKRVGQKGKGDFIRISWDEALDTVVEKIQRIKVQEGPESVAWYIAYTKEPRPYFRRLAHAYGSPNYCTETSSCFSAGWLAATLNFGEEYGYMLRNSREIDPASKSMIIWSSGVKQSSPHYWNDYLKAKEAGLKFITVDPRRTRFASISARAQILL